MQDEYLSRHPQPEKGGNPWLNAWQMIEDPDYNLDQDPLPAWMRAKRAIVKNWDAIVELNGNRQRTIERVSNFKELVSLRPSAPGYEPSRSLVLLGPSLHDGLQGCNNPCVEVTHGLHHWAVHLCCYWLEKEHQLGDLKLSYVQPPERQHMIDTWDPKLYEGTPDVEPEYEDYMDRFLAISEKTADDEEDQSEMDTVGSAFVDELLQMDDLEEEEE